MISPENPVIQLFKIFQLTQSCFSKVCSAEYSGVLQDVFDVEKSNDLAVHRAWFEMVLICLWTVDAGLRKQKLASESTMESPLMLDFRK